MPVPASSRACARGPVQAREQRARPRIRLSFRSAPHDGGRALRPAAHGAPGRLGGGGGGRGPGGGGRARARCAAGRAEHGASHDCLQLDAGDGGRVDAEIVSVPARPARHTVRPPGAPRAAPDAAPSGGWTSGPRRAALPAAARAAHAPALRGDSRGGSAIPSTPSPCWPPTLGTSVLGVGG